MTWRGSWVARAMESEVMPMKVWLERVCEGIVVLVYMVSP